MTGEVDLKLYERLINMRFDDGISLKAATECKDINGAIEWMESNKDIQKDEINDDDDENEYKYIDIDCDGNDISNCLALKRIISMLQFYDNNHMNYNALNEYLTKYKFHLISDYHHILNNHLNEDNISSIKSNQQFNQILNIIKDNNLQCNIQKCAIYTRNNRQRETTNIECNDNKLSIFIDIIDTIHCYFMHSVDIGYRIIHNLNEEKEDDNNDDINVSDAYDPQMRRLHDYVQRKRKLLQSIRGEKRIFNNKFMTHTSG